MIDEKRLLGTLHELLKINSPSKKERILGEYIAGCLSNLGIETTIDNTSGTTGADIGNLIARVDGGLSGDPILFSAHLDTIESTQDLEIIEKDGRILSNGKSILGADDKAGLAIIIEMLETLKQSGRKHLPVELVFSVSEEIGLVGASALDFTKLRSRMGFCFDGGGDPSHLIMNSPTQETIEVSFRGKAVHAGVEPEKGANAIYAVAKAAADFPQGRLDEDTTANLGTISGGKATNIVADNAEYKAEVRGHDRLKLDATVQMIKQKAKQVAVDTKTQVDINQSTSFEGFTLNEDESVVKIAIDALKECGIKPAFTKSGGGSDANIFNQNGIKTLTLPMGAQKAHSKEEFVDIKNFTKAAQIAVKLVEAASAGQA
ncbi:hypothetical protein LCGC14_0484510 [marine sediment metagenome]|uniref:Peptidase M20 dimerisation domain-containing protein n=1 Tax=marine sediment metagenome TaxID=412755 RepID=A0A0F9SRK2_9ZZZZ